MAVDPRPLAHTSHPLQFVAFLFQCTCIPEKRIVGTVVETRRVLYFHYSINGEIYLYYKEPKQLKLVCTWTKYHVPLTANLCVRAVDLDLEVQTDDFLSLENDSADPPGFSTPRSILPAPSTHHRLNGKFR